MDDGKVRYELFVQKTKGIDLFELVIIDFMEFKNKLAVYLGEESINDYMRQNNITVSFTVIYENIKNTLVDIFFCDLIIYNEVDALIEFLNYMIAEYGFIIDEKFLVRNEKSINIRMLIYLNNYIDLKKYIPTIKNIFIRQCEYINSADDLEKFKELGFDIHEFYYDDGPYFNNTSLYSSIINKSTLVLKYLLEHGFDLKKYELPALKLCISEMKFHHLKILLEHGADLSLLNRLRPEFYERGENFIGIYKILQENNIDPMVIAELIASMNTVKMQLRT